MKRLIIVFVGLVMLLPTTTRADEGMWLPLLVKRLNYQDMKAHGLQLSADEIYDVNNASLKDAIVVLNGGSCTAEMISGQGLFLTNHHCAYGSIQDNSSTEHDYLTDGFWAYAKGEELQAKGMTAGFLVEMRDVTDAILGDVSISLTGPEREKAISAAIAATSEKIKGEVEAHYDIKIRSFFEGNEYYAFVYETFRDVRLVGAPPSSIGKYGGDTDNWMWPRHTGDFSLMRVYMGADGKPADYSADNVPYSPKHFLPVSIDGVDKGDFAMIMGYPGSTDRYLSSYGVQQELTVKQPNTVKIREKKLALLKEDMNASSEVRIKYASKYAQTSNYWKYFIGQQRGLKRLNVKGKKEALEAEFQNWVNADASRKEIYGNVLENWKTAFESSNETAMFFTYFNECIFSGSEALLMSYRASSLEMVLSAEEVNQEKVDQLTADLKNRADKFFKDYNMPTDKKVSAALFEIFYNDVPKDLQPESFKNLVSKNKSDFSAMIDKMYDKSIFTSEERLNEFLANPSAKALDKDPVFNLMKDFIAFYRGTVAPMSGENQDKIETSNRLFVNGLRKMNVDKTYYPNANSTMRLTYGNVLDYYPADAMYYNYFTTIDGIMEKEDPTNDEFIVPAKLKELYNAKDYGRYGEDGTLRVCFLTNTDITGGNSGSPVINGKGELIGCAFDGNWEAMSGDIAFEPTLQRTIAVDIRYVLFIIDKYAGAQNIIDELKIVSTPVTERPAPLDATATEVKSTQTILKSSK
ncbi:MAG: S46 family peptidase [Salibacteraceae bacterium]|nr:S46 family peptidase [Salibacteraceae bacterium]